MPDHPQPGAPDGVSARDAAPPPEAPRARAEASRAVAPFPARHLETDVPRRARIGLWVAAIASVAPIVVAAVRNGLQGWTPTLDAAATATRARDVFSAHPPLLGMWSAGSSWAGMEIHFPGALQLYLLAVPVHLFGNSWGVQLGMAAMNVGWVLAAGWLVKRRVGTNGAIIGFLLLGMMVWAMGSEVMVDITPMQMIAIPFALFLVGVWSVADGDHVAIPPLVFAANYLLLNHLTFTLLVPAIGLTAIVGLVVSLRRLKRTDPDAWRPHLERVKRMVAWSAVMTVLLWLIPLYQQLTGDPPNITNLLRASAVDRPTTSTYAEAAHAVAAIVSEPPFWLRDSYEHPSFGLVSVFRWASLPALALVVGAATLAWFAHRRRDHTVVWGLIVAGVAMLASVANIVQAPNLYGFRPEYLRSLWVMAMFVWLTLAIALFRLVPRPKQSAVGSGALALTLVVAALAMPMRDLGAGTTRPSIPLANELNAQLIPQLRDKGTIRVIAYANFEAWTYTSSVILALNTEGIPYCVGTVGSGQGVEQFGHEHDCAHGVDYLVSVGPSVATSPAGFEPLAAAYSLPDDEVVELHDLRAQVRSWLADQEALQATQPVRDRFVGTFGAKAEAALAAYLEPASGDLSALVGHRPFIDFVIAQSQVDADGTVHAPIDTGPVRAADLLAWAHLERRMIAESVAAWGRPADAPSAETDAAATSDPPVEAN